MLDQSPESGGPVQYSCVGEVKDIMKTKIIGVEDVVGQWVDEKDVVPLEVASSIFYLFYNNLEMSR